MIRFISVALFVVIFLILSIPLLIAEWIIGKFNMDIKNRSSLAIVNWAFRWCLRLSGVKITYIGEERIPKDQAVLYIGNHRSYFDILMTYVRVPRPTGYVAKLEMLKIPLLSHWMKNLHCLFLDRKDPEALANRIWEELGVVTPSTSFPVRRMSGGNVQKVLVGREIAQSPAVLMTAYAVRGLDINTSYTIYNLLTEQKMHGVAVVYVGEDLDVLLELCDRIVVLCGGQVSGVVDARKTDKREVGALMTLVRGGNKDE